MKRGLYKLYLQDGSIPILVTTISRKLRRQLMIDQELCDVHILNKKVNVQYI